MKIGYARVSSIGQNLDAQLGKLNSYGCEKIFQEKASAASGKKRTELEQALEYCREGDVLVVTKLDRLARSMADLHNIAQTLEKKHVDFVVLDQNIDTTTPTGKFTFNMLGAVAVFERDMIAERQAEGIAKAKEKGVKFGRKVKLDSKQEMEVLAAFQEGKSKSEIARDFGISRSTIYRIAAKHTELSTVQAAEVLNVSRPFLIKLLEEEKIPHRKVGKHRRIRMEDVMAYKSAIDQEREAVLDQLVAEAQEQDMGYGE